MSSGRSIAVYHYNSLCYLLYIYYVDKPCAHCTVSVRLYGVLFHWTCEMLLLNNQYFRCTVTVILTLIPYYI